MYSSEPFKKLKMEQTNSNKDMMSKTTVMPYFFLYGDEIVKLVETDKNVSVAMNLLGKRFTVATKHLQIMPPCRKEICKDLQFCSIAGHDIKCNSYFCFDYEKLELATV
jgi:hypothetical protein